MFVSATTPPLSCTQPMEGAEVALVAESVTHRAMYTTCNQSMGGQISIAKARGTLTELTLE